MLKRLSTCLRSWRIISPMSSTRLPAERAKQMKNEQLCAKSAERELLHRVDGVRQLPTCEHYYISTCQLQFDKFYLPCADPVMTNWLCHYRVNVECDTLNADGCREAEWRRCKNETKQQNMKYFQRWGRWVRVLFNSNLPLWQGYRQSHSESVGQMHCVQKNILNESVHPTFRRSSYALRGSSGWQSFSCKMREKHENSGARLL